MGYLFSAESNLVVRVQMKLLVCCCCNEVFSLKVNRKKYCSCKKSWGKYEKDGLKATYGGSALLIGFNNRSFTQSIRDQLRFQDFDLEEIQIPGPYYGELKGRAFEAFVIPESASSTKRVGKTPIFASVLNEMEGYKAEISKKKAKRIDKN